MIPASRMAGPAGAPAYYLGRPASWWIAAVRRQSAGRPGMAAGTVHKADGPPAVTGVLAVDSGEACQQAISAGLLVHGADPLNAETPLAALAGAAVVPSDQFYVRNHFGIPDLDPATWRLEVGGLAGRPLALSLAELRSMRSRTEVAVMECAGNGRSALDPAVPGEQWGLGAVGMAAWTGVPLTEVLGLAAPAPGAHEVVFRGADRGQVEGRAQPAHFERSLALRFVASAGALLAYAMNGRQLPRLHGYPLRLIVPGWYGVASVKWLTGIELTGRPFNGFFQADRYHINGRPVTLQAVRSVITEPRSGETVGPGEVVVRGLAWSGAAPIARVEVSVAGQTWKEATLTRQGHPHGWQPWQLRALLGRPGNVVIRARAADMAGRTQPDRPQWNPLGYATNPIHEIQIRIRPSRGVQRSGMDTTNGAAGETATARRNPPRTELIRKSVPRWDAAANRPCGSRAGLVFMLVRRRVRG